MRVGLLLVAIRTDNPGVHRPASGHVFAGGGNPAGGGDVVSPIRKRAARGVFLRHPELNVGDKRGVPGDTLSHHDHGGDRESRNVR